MYRFLFWEGGGGMNEIGEEPYRVSNASPATRLPPSSAEDKVYLKKKKSQALVTALKRCGHVC